VRELHRQLAKDLQRMRSAGAGVEAIFQHAAAFGLVPELRSLARSGAIPCELVLEHAAQLPHAVRHHWLALAALAALARERPERCVLLLGEALRLATDPADLQQTVLEIWACADQATRARLLEC